jgi:hypothetical protein
MLHFQKNKEKKLKKWQNQKNSVIGAIIFLLFLYLCQNTLSKIYFLNEIGRLTSIFLYFKHIEEYHHNNFHVYCLFDGNATNKTILYQEGLTYNQIVKIDSVGHASINITIANDILKNEYYSYDISARDISYRNKFICFLLSGYIEREEYYFRIVKNFCDVEKIYSNFPKSGINNIYNKKISQEELMNLFATVNNDIFYCWFYEKGIFKITLKEDVKHLNLVGVEVKFCGYLENEYIQHL